MRAGNAFEALVQNGSPAAVDRGFFRVIGAASYHLASYSALAFSLIAQRPADANLAPAEQGLASLILRDLTGLSVQARDWLLNPQNGDDEIVRRATEGEIDSDDVITLIGTTTMFRAFAFFELALQTGSNRLVDEARSLLRRCVSLARDANAVPLWWIARMSR